MAANRRVADLTMTASAEKLTDMSISHHPDVGRLRTGLRSSVV